MIRTFISAVVLAGVALAALVACPGAGAENGVTLRAGAAAVKITPSLDRTVFIAGYDNNRIANAVHDDLWARALVLDDGKTRMAVVACDLIGLSNFRVRKLRALIHSVPAENVLIASTHVHSGPDTLGLWGAGPFTTGLDPAYLDALGQHVAQAVDEAARHLRPVSLTAGSVIVPDGLVYNSREEIQDKRLTALRFTDAKGTTVATVVNYGGHPEINKSRSLTSDFVHYVREEVEKRFGGTCVFLNGALGGMVTPKISGHTWEEVERVGRGVGSSAVKALTEARPISDPALSIRRKSVELPLENPKFQIAVGAHLLDAEATNGRFATEVWRVDLGPITWITIPGEILPRPALALKAEMPGPYPMIVALGNDELGYILDPDDFDKKLYSYEHGMSVGKQTWPLLFAAARSLLK